MFGCCEYKQWEYHATIHSATTEIYLQIVSSIIILARDFVQWLQFTITFFLTEELGQYANK